MFGIGSEDTGVHYGAIIDVGSGSVGVGIVESDRRKPLPQVIFSHRELMRPDTHSSSKRDDRLRQMREALLTASLRLSSHGLKALTEHDKHAKIDKILVTCSSPWSHTVTRIISYENEEPVEVTMDLIQDLIKEAEEDLLETLEDNVTASKLGLRIVERATVGVKINGYTVHDPMSLKGTEFELSHILGLVPEDILEAVGEVQEKVLVDTKLSAHTFMLVNYCVMRDIFPDHEDLCVIDVTGESTELGVIKDNVLLEDTHAPYGMNTLIRDLSEATGGTNDSSLSLIRAYSDNTMSEKERATAEKHFEEYKKVLGEAVHRLYKKHTIPGTLVITALPQVAPFFTALIPEVLTDITDREYVLLNVDQGMLDKIATKENRDTYIALASRFFHKLHGCGEI